MSVVANVPSTGANTSAVFEAAVQGGTPAFTTAMTAIATFSTSMVQQPETGNAVADAVLQTVKQHASQWFDTIDPQYKNMPATVLQDGSQIDSQLATLTKLAAQLSADPKDKKLRAAVDAQAGALASTVTSILSQTKALAGDLSTFSKNVAQDVQSLTTAIGTLDDTVATAKQSIVALNAQLTALQNATCPNATAISECSTKIGSEKSTLDNANDGLGGCQSAHSTGHEAAMGATYLSNYWGCVSDDGDQCVTVLTALQKAPASVVKIDLKAATARWQAFKKQLAQADAT